MNQKSDSAKHSPTSSGSDLALGNKLPFLMAFGWGMGTLAPAMLLTASNILLLRFMTDFVGIGAAFAGGLIAFSKIYDAVTDPVMGVITDRTRTKIGRRRPYLMIGGLALAISLLVIFNPPNLSGDAMKWYMAFALLFFATAYTIFNVPYLAMPAEMTKNYNQRSTLMSYRIYAVALSNVAVAVIGPVLIDAFGGGLRGHSMMSWVLAPLVLGASILAYFATKNAPYYPTPISSAKKPPIKEQFAMITANKPFIVLITAKLFQLLTFGAQAAFPFFFTKILQASDSALGLYFLILTGGMIFSQPLWLWVAKRFGKKKTYIIALSMSIILSLTWLLAGPEESAAILYARGILVGIGAGGGLLMGQAMLPDTQEYDALKSGVLREGILSGIYTTMEKVAQAIGVAFVGAFLGAMGYVASSGGTLATQPESAITAISLSVALIPAAGLSVALFLIMFFYNLSEDKLIKMRAESVTEAV